MNIFHAAWLMLITWTDMQNLHFLTYQCKFLTKKLHTLNMRRNTREKYKSSIWLDSNNLIKLSGRILGKSVASSRMDYAWDWNIHPNDLWFKKGGFDVGWLPEDVLPLSVLINLYDERHGGEELMTAPLFFSQSLNNSNPKLKQLKPIHRDMQARIQHLKVFIIFVLNRNRH